MSEREALLREIDETLAYYEARPQLAGTSELLLARCREALSAQPAEPKQERIYGVCGHKYNGRMCVLPADHAEIAAPPAAEPKQQTEDLSGGSVGGAAAPRMPSTTELEIRMAAIQATNRAAKKLMGKEAKNGTEENGHVAATGAAHPVHAERKMIVELAEPDLATELNLVDGLTGTKSVGGEDEQVERLIGRLRDIAQEFCEEPGDHFRVLKDAARRIESLTAERDQLKEQRGTYLGEHRNGEWIASPLGEIIIRIEAERDRAVEALRVIENRLNGPSYKMGHDITQIVLAAGQPSMLPNG